MKKTIITTLFALVALVGQAQVSPDTITVCFKLSSKTKGEEATFVYPDFQVCDIVALKPVTDSNGCWTVKIPTFQTLHIQIWDNNKIQGVVWGALNLFCRPGTRTDILLDDVNDRCIFTGEDAEAHQAQITHPLKIENFHGQMFDIDLQEAAQAIRRIHKQNIYRIDTLRTAHPDLPSRYVEGLRTMADYGFGMDMTQNIKGHFFDSMTKILEQGNTVPQEYLDLLHEVKTHNLLYPQGLLSREATTYFSDLISIEDLVKNGIIRKAIKKKGDYQLKEFKQYCSLIDAIDTSEDVKQMMKSYRFLKDCNREITPEREKFLRTQLTADVFGQLQSYINGMKAKFEAISIEEAQALDETPIDSLVDGKDIFQKLIAPYRGRVVYVDFWGTWCGPCMREMEYVNQLHKTLKDLPVTYMYLANNSPEELWQKTAKRFGLEGDDCQNLHLPNQQQHAVEEFLGVIGFPTFVLVAPDGTIVTKEAPRPSQPDAVREAVLKLIEK